MGQKRQNLVRMVTGARGGRYLPGVRSEKDQSRGIVLPDHQVREDGCQSAGVIEFIRVALPEIHRGACIEKDMATNVRVVFELLDVILLGAAPDFPIHISQVVARHVRTIGGEFGAVAEERAAMHTIEKPFHHRFRQKREVINGRQSGGFDGKGRRHQREAVVIGSARSFSMMSLIVIFWARALKLVSTRWRSTWRATDLTPS